MEILKSDYQEIFPVDCKKYKEISKRYMDLEAENGLEAYKLMKDAWNSAQRFSELAACGKKIKTMAGYDVTATEFKAWAHDRYTQMGKIHDSSRMIWKYCNDNLKNTM